MQRCLFRQTRAPKRPTHPSVAAQPGMALRPPAAIPVLMLLCAMWCGLAPSAHAQMTIGPPPGAKSGKAAGPVAPSDEALAIDDEPAIAPLDDDAATLEEVSPGRAAILALVPDLDSGKAGPDAVEALSALKDVRVLRLFDRLMLNELQQYGERYVWVPTASYGTDDDGRNVADLYDPLAESERLTIDGKPATVLSGDLDGFGGNRAVRRLLQTRLSLMALEVDDPAARLNAVIDLGNKQKADALPALLALADDDPDPRVRRAAAESVALIRATGSEPDATSDEQLAAIQHLGEVGSIRARGPLQDLLRADTAAPGHLAAAQTSLNQIDRHITVTNWIKNAFFGLSAGSILVLLALGLAITFGLMGVINMAHGEMLMIGAVTTWATWTYFSGGNLVPFLPVWPWPMDANWTFVVAFPLSFLAAAAVGWLTEVTVVRHLYKRPLDSLLATIGVSFILIQLVRLWKGDNLGMATPTWFAGGWEVMPDVTLAYNRLFLLALTAFCVVGTMLLFRFTRMGLMIRATVQNRDMAQSLGVNTRRVDMFTFAFGAGVAGLAGYGLILITNPTPGMGQNYIVEAFLVTVVGGVGKLLGVVISGLSLGFLNKFLEPVKLDFMPFAFFDSTWSWVTVLVAVVLFITRRPGGLFPDKGRAAAQATANESPFTAPYRRRQDVILGVAFAVLGLVVVPLLYGTGDLSPGFVNKLGYILTFAICAIGLDLLWGYLGVLSLCQFLFFALGGYAMGLYLINHGPMAGANNDIPAALFVVMSGVGEAKPPWFLAFFNPFPLAVFLGMVIPGLLALLIGVLTFRSRVRGVYFAILTQAICVAFWLVFQKNDIRLGGTNGLTNFTHILGYPIAGDSFPSRATGESRYAYLMEHYRVAFTQTRFWLFVATFLALAVVLTLAKLLVHSRFGRVLVAIRDDETRLRFAGYNTWVYKALVFALAGVFAGIGGMLYAPQIGIINPKQLAPIASIMVVVYVAIGGRATLWGPVIGAVAVSLLYDTLTSGAPGWYADAIAAVPTDFARGWLAFAWSAESWMIVLGLLFILVPLLLPGGLMSIPTLLTRALTRHRPTTERPVRALPLKGGAA